MTCTASSTCGNPAQRGGERLVGGPVGEAHLDEHLQARARAGRRRGGHDGEPADGAVLDEPTDAVRRRVGAEAHPRAELAKGSRASAVSSRRIASSTGSIRRSSQPRRRFRSIRPPGAVALRRLWACRHPSLLGVLAGLAVAMPVGPVGVLLLRTGLVDGVRVAVAAACGIATVDLAYAVVAVAVGAPVSRVLGEHASLVRGTPARWCSLSWVSAGWSPRSGPHVGRRGGPGRLPARRRWVPTCASSGSPRSTR